MAESLAANITPAGLATWMGHMRRCPRCHGGDLRFKCALQLLIRTRGTGRQDDTYFPKGPGIVKTVWYPSSNPLVLDSPVHAREALTYQDIRFEMSLLSKI